MLAQACGNADPCASRDSSVGAANSSLADSGVSNFNWVYRTQDGRLAYTTCRRTKDGLTPSHLLALPSGRHRHETWEQYEDRVLYAPGDRFARPPEPIMDIDSLTPQTQARLKVLLRSAFRAGHLFGVRETKRSVDRQERLFRIGRVDDSLPVTWTLTSSHMTGEAVDLMPFSKPNAAYHWLARHARCYEFGVLGAIDPGHIFLLHRKTLSAWPCENCGLFRALVMRMRCGNAPVADVNVDH